MSESNIKDYKNADNKDCVIGVNQYNKDGRNDQKVLFDWCDPW